MFKTTNIMRQKAYYHDNSWTVSILGHFDFQNQEFGFLWTYIFLFVFITVATKSLNFFGLEISLHHFSYLMGKQKSDFFKHLFSQTLHFFLISIISTRYSLHNDPFNAAYLNCRIQETVIPDSRNISKSIGIVTASLPLPAWLGYEFSFYYVRK